MFGRRRGKANQKQTRNQKPETRNQKPEDARSSFGLLVFWFAFSGFLFLVSGFWFLVSGLPRKLLAMCVRVAVLVSFLLVPSAFPQCTVSPIFSAQFRSTFNDLSLDGNDLWTATSYGLALYDRGVDPPALVASIALPGTTRGVRVLNGSAYAGSGNAIAVVQKNSRALTLLRTTDEGGHAAVRRHRARAAARRRGVRRRAGPQHQRLRLHHDGHADRDLQHIYRAVLRHRQPRRRRRHRREPPLRRRRRRRPPHVRH